MDDDRMTTPRRWPNPHQAKKGTTVRVDGKLWVVTHREWKVRGRLICGCGWARVYETDGETE